MDGYSPALYIPERGVPAMASPSPPRYRYSPTFYIPNTPAVAAGPSSWSSHFVDVKDFGAKGDCSLTTSVGTDDTAAIQAAIDSTSYTGVNSGKIALLSGGHYKTTAPLNMTEGGSLAGVVITRGSPAAALSTIEFFGGPTDNCVQAIGLSSHSLSRCVVERFRIDDRRTSPTGGNGVYYENVDNQTWVRNMDIIGFPTGSSILMAGVGSSTDCIVIDDIWTVGSQYGINVHDIDNACFIHDIKCDSNQQTQPLISAIRVSRNHGVVLINGVKHENRKASTSTITLDTDFSGIVIDGIVSRTGVGGPVVNMLTPSGSGSGVTIRGLQRDFSGTLVTITNKGSIVGYSLQNWIGGSEGYWVNGARVVGQYDQWGRIRVEGDVMVAPVAGNKLSFWGGTLNASAGTLTYSRATENAAQTQLRTALASRGLVIDSTVP